MPTRLNQLRTPLYRPRILPRWIQAEELSLPDRAKLKELERENRELRLMNDFLKKATAYFAREQQ